jgi:hypothetical protein
MKRLFIGIDNGTTGTIGAVTNDGAATLLLTPTKSEQSYTKTAKTITRIDYGALKAQLKHTLETFNADTVLVALERPMANPTRFAATQSAMRSIEATLIAIEELQLPFRYIDSKEWQKAMLPSGIVGGPQLKKASADIGTRSYPQFAELIKRHGDADGILIAEYLLKSAKQ